MYTADILNEVFPTKECLFSVNCLFVVFDLKKKTKELNVNGINC